MFSKRCISGYDDRLFAAIKAEERRREKHIRLDRLENYTRSRVSARRKARCQ